MLRPRGLGPDGRCHAPHIAGADPPFWHSIARPCIRPQPGAEGRGRMQFLVRAPDLAFAMWDVFPMARGSGGHSSTRSNAGELPHGPLRRLAALHVELTTWIGGPGLFLHFFMPCRTDRTVFCDPNRLFLGPHGKNAGIEPGSGQNTVALSITELIFAVFVLPACDLS